jgi:hypothetical protein
MSAETPPPGRRQPGRQRRNQRTRDTRPVEQPKRSVDDTVTGRESDAAFDEPHGAAGAYVLDALAEDERLAFEAHLTGCADCQRAVAELAPVVGVLPRLLELDSVPVLAGMGAAEIPEPSADLRQRIVAAARAEQSATTTIAEPAAPEPATTLDSEPAGGPDVPAVPSAGEETPPIVGDTPETMPATPTPVRPPGRIRPGRVVASAPRAPGTSIRRFPETISPAWLAAAVLAVIAVGTLIWGLSLQGDIDDRQAEVAERQATIEALDAQLAEIRQRANATSYQLAPTDQGPDQAAGEVLYSLPNRTGALFVTGLPVLPENQDYQVWYLEGETPIPGAVFDVDANGSGVVRLAEDVPTFDGVALTAEPTGGSDTPTGDVLLVATTGGAAG